MDGRPPASTGPSVGPSADGPSSQETNCSHDASDTQVAPKAKPGLVQDRRLSGSKIGTGDACSRALPWQVPVAGGQSWVFRSLAPGLVVRQLPRRLGGPFVMDSSPGPVWRCPVHSRAQVRRGYRQIACDSFTVGPPAPAPNRGVPKRARLMPPRYVFFAASASAAAAAACAATAAGPWGGIWGAAAEPINHGTNGDEARR